MDHAAFLYLVSKQSVMGKLARWMLLLQEFEFDIQHRLGAQHVVADYLSHLDSKEVGEGHYDDFPDGHVLHISAAGVKTKEVSRDDKWFTYI